MVSVQPTAIAQLISEQYMVELHSPTGRDMIFVYLADYVSPTRYTLYNNTNPSGFSHIYTRKVLLPHNKHYDRYPIYFPLCNSTLTSLRFIIHVHSLDYIFTSEHINNLLQSGRKRTRGPVVAPSVSRLIFMRLS